MTEMCVKMRIRDVGLIGLFVVVICVCYFVAFYSADIPASAKPVVKTVVCSSPRHDDHDPKRYERLVLGKTLSEAEALFPDDTWRVLKQRVRRTLELIVGPCPHLNRVNVHLDAKGMIERLDLG